MNISLKNGLETNLQYNTRVFGEAATSVLMTAIMVIGALGAASQVSGAVLGWTVAGCSLGLASIFFFQQRVAGKKWAYDDIKVGILLVALAIVGTVTAMGANSAHDLGWLITGGVIVGLSYYKLNKAINLVTN